MLSLLLNLAAVGLTVGSLYALIAVSFGLIFNITRVFHLAHGAVFTIGGYLVFWLSTSLGLPLVLALLISIVVSGALGVFTEVVLYRPLRRAQAAPMILFLASVGALIVVEGVLGLAFGTQVRNFQQLPANPIDFGVITMPISNLAMLGAWLLIAITVLYLVRTRSGSFLRAVGDSPVVASSIGIPIDRMFGLSFALGSALAVPAALLYGWQQGLTPGMGLNAILIGSAGVIIGGRHGLLPGAIVALLLGTIQALTVAVVPTGWQEGITFAVLLLALLIRPQGIFGYALPW